MKMVVFSIPASTALAADKLRELAGTGKLAVREWRIRERLNWQAKPKTAVRHLLQGEQFPKPDEASQIEAAYEADSRAALIASITEFAARAERVDAEFFGPTIEALRESLRRLGGQEDGPSAESNRAGRTSRGRRHA